MVKYQRILSLWARKTGRILIKRKGMYKDGKEFTRFDCSNLSELDFKSLYDFYIKLETSRNEYRRTPKKIVSYTIFRGSLQSSHWAPSNSNKRTGYKDGEIIEIERTEDNNNKHGAHGHISPRHSIHYKKQKVGRNQGSR